MKRSLLFLLFSSMAAALLCQEELVKLFSARRRSLLSVLAGPAGPAATPRAPPAPPERRRTVALRIQAPAHSRLPKASRP